MTLQRISARFVSPLVRVLPSLLLLLVAVCQADGQEVGAVAARQGTAEIGHGGTWSDARPGAAIQLGDTLRTGSPGRLQLVLRDQSVLNLGDNTELLVDRQVFDPERRSYESLFSIVRGKVRALVSEYYGEPSAAFEMRSSAAVAGVRGTEFVMTYDPETETSEVVGIADTVEVYGIHDRKRSVVITAQELTVVRRGFAPTAPRRIEDELFRQYLEGLKFGAGRRSGSLAASNPVTRGLVIGEANRAPVIRALRTQAVRRAASEARRRITAQDAANLVGQSPRVVRQRHAAGGIGIEF